MQAQTFYVGLDGEQVVSSEITRKQIADVKALECDLVNPENVDEKATWDVFDDPSEPRTLFQSILADRKRRVDEKTLMADRPSFCVVTAIGDRAVRLEYYEGHDALSLVYDLRSRELIEKELPAFLESDPQAYDPVEYLTETFPELAGQKKEIKEILNQVHHKS